MSLFYRSPTWHEFCLQECQLTWVSLQECQLTWVSFQDCHLSYLSFTGVPADMSWFMEVPADTSFFYRSACWHELIYGSPSWHKFLLQECQLTWRLTTPTHWSSSPTWKWEHSAPPILEVGTWASSSIYCKNLQNIQIHCLKALLEYVLHKEKL